MQKKNKLQNHRCINSKAKLIVAFNNIFEHIKGSKKLQLLVFSSKITAVEMFQKNKIIFRRKNVMDSLIEKTKSISFRYLIRKVSSFCYP